MSYGYVPTPLPPPVSRPSWFSRNWKWFLPTVMVGPILLIGLFIGGIFSLVFGMMKSSEPYQHAVGVAASDPRVVSELGAPITPGWYASGTSMFPIAPETRIWRSRSMEAAITALFTS